MRYRIRKITYNDFRVEYKVEVNRDPEYLKEIRIIVRSLCKNGIWGYGLALIYLLIFPLLNLLAYFFSWDTKHVRVDDNHPFEDAPIDYEGKAKDLVLKMKQEEYEKKSEKEKQKIKDKELKRRDKLLKWHANHIKKVRRIEIIKTDS